MTPRLMLLPLAFALVATVTFADAEGEEAGAATEQEMVRDPSTGEMIRAPQYGGQFTIAALRDEPPHADTWWGVTSMWAISPVLEKLGMVDWAIDRDVWDLKSGFTSLEVVKPHLAESYETPDPLTYIVHLRPGIRWHDKAPMNGRELVADDIVFNYHRMTGLGSGFSEKSPYATNVSELPFESITAPDKYTVVFKLKEVNFEALDFIYFESHEAAWIYVQAAQAIGVGTGRTIFRHVLPNIMAPMIVIFTVTIGDVIIAEASLTFLGLGLPPDVASWGGMLSWEGRRYMERVPALALWPGLCLFTVVWGTNMFGDAMRDLLDPSLKGGVGRYQKPRTKYS